ncbi:chymotrypsin-like protease CTRL-1 isoform X1 [Perca fluviatilis]|uniref:chymotrypsin-like protease CTRL-1 isoform X1 n=1 Tax=Perca fluviatilis TaxID=8168 RepID=UPI0019645460|nr:chymotrypsin-like protease CTRL-1 isoform X1 [Perca fluviatilis]
MMAAWTGWILLMCAVLTGQGSKAQDCGLAPLNTRIVGGENATAGAWPWQVSMHINFAAIHICGGTLISDQWVLTAASCIILNFPSVWILYFGRKTQSGPNVHEVNRTVSQIIIHPDYNNVPFNNDIALMKLSSPVNFTNYIRPVCLASNFSQFYNSTPCWATGWGRLGKDEPLPAFDSLQEVQIPVIGEKQCSCNYLPIQGINITDKMICAGQENKGTCQGDGGGPLQCKQSSMWIQAGISSFVIPCALDGFPDGYARVSEFQTWIMDQVMGANVQFVTFRSSGTDQDNSFVCRSSVPGNATTAAPNATSTAAPNATSTAAPNTTSTPSTVATKLTMVVILVTLFLQHIVAP